ncbi:hypothetical protein AUC70_08910 [Methyloceanibacter stevinii]|uniref:Uncharacterized protein n=1 Tax=Methyloceanibacter stevinii TaxID=1774970 RepID=A0A1E3VMH5_9HYPH|nr:hypothetical protein [Methyloceanibacter stevinii]ODR94714.1 hypothetical protein AUC70_08910 [Methyloceanibacter stevinii]
MEFYLFRLSLKAKEADFFVKRAPDGSPLTRQDWLRLFFSQKHEFIHYRSKFVFKPETRIGSEDHPHLMFGWIAREMRQYERTPPDEGLEPTEHMSWQAIFTIVDTQNDSQLISMEYNADLGKPKALLESLVREMNHEEGAPFQTQAFPLVSAGSFWQFAEEHGNQIVWLSFDVAAPNMFDDVDDFQKELRALRDKVNVANVSAKLESDTTLKIEAERVGGIVDYVERGAGELAAEAEDGSRYSSTSHEKKVNLDIDHHTKGERRFFREIMHAIGRLLPK